MNLQTFLQMKTALQDGIVSMAKSLQSFVRTTIPDMISALKKSFQNTFDFMLTAVKNLYSKGKSIISSMVEKTSSGLQNISTSLVNVLGGMRNRFVSFFSSLGKLIGKKTIGSTNDRGLGGSTLRASGGRAPLLDDRKIGPPSGRASGSRAPSLDAIVGKPSGGISGVAAVKTPSLAKAGSLSLGPWIKAAELLVDGAMLLKDVAIADEKNEQSLSKFVGADQAKQVYRNIQVDTSNTSFDLDSLLQANQSLLSVGVKAEDARKNVMNLANAVTATGGNSNDLTNLSEAMKKIKAEGIASEEALLQFGYSGIDIYTAISNSTGKGVEDVRNMTISYEMLSEALDEAAKKEGMYANALSIQSGKMDGKMKKISDMMQVSLSTLASALAPVINNVLSVFAVISERIPGVISSMQPLIDIINQLPIQEYFLYIFTIVEVLFQQFGFVIEQLKPIFYEIFEAIKPLMGIVQELIKLMLVGLLPIFGVIAKVVATVLAPLINVIGQVLNAVLEQILKITDFIVPKIEGIAKKATVVIDLFSKKWFKGDTKKDAEHKAGDASVPEPADLSNPFPGFKMPNADSDTVAKGVTSGGPRVININGVKFTDKIELHVNNLTEGLNEIEAKFDEYLLRILNSGSALQS